MSIPENIPVTFFGSRVPVWVANGAELGALTPSRSATFSSRAEASFMRGQYKTAQPAQR